MGLVEILRKSLSKRGISALMGSTLH